MVLSFASAAAQPLLLKIAADVLTLRAAERSLSSVIGVSYCGTWNTSTVRVSSRFLSPLAWKI